MNARRTVLLGLALTGSICAFAAGAAANTFTVAPLTLVTGPSPFAGCTVGAAPGSVLYPNAEEEPWIDVNPTNPNNLIAVWQQDRWNDGGAHGLATGVSHDGGVTWTETFPHFSTCAGGTAANGGDVRRARSDPWVSFGPDGTAYQVSLSFNANDPTSAILASTSTDGGDTWSDAGHGPPRLGRPRLVVRLQRQGVGHGRRDEGGLRIRRLGPLHEPGSVLPDEHRGPHQLAGVPRADLVLPHNGRRPHLGAGPQHLRP